MMKRLFTTLFIALLSVATTWATDYDLWIAGTRLTSDNAISALNIPGVKGTAYYIPSSNTLNLSSAMILPTSSSVLPLYAKSGVSGLTIDVSGVCTIRSGGNIAMLIEGLDTLHIKGSGTLIVEAESYDIFFTSDYLSIEDGVSVYLIGGGLYNDGNYDETLEVNNANLFVRRSDPTWNPISMRDLVLTNAYLDSPAWSSYQWNGAELTNGNQWWYGDINIKAGTSPSRSGSSSYDIDGDGGVSLGDVTALVNVILNGGAGGSSGGGNPSGTGTHQYVDLGLPSGTLWATTNVGAARAELLGDFFAWGETVPYFGTDTSNLTNYNYAGTYVKTYYGWATYKWSQGSNTTITKYCNDASYGYNGFTDSKTELELTDDAAYVNWGPEWRTPSKEQLEELISGVYTNMEWEFINGTRTYKITSKANGNSIVMPCLGYRREGVVESVGNGEYWSRTLDNSEPKRAYRIEMVLDFGTGIETITNSGSFRFYGLPIRPVRAQ